MKRLPKIIKKLENELDEARKERDEEIRRLYSTGGWTLLELAKKYDLTKQRISKIVNREED